MSALTLPGPTAPPAPPAAQADPFAHLPPVRPLRWTREEYYQMSEAGVFTGKRVMLIDGEVLAMVPQNEPHANGITATAYCLATAFDPSAVTFRQQSPLDLGQTSDPEPDVAVVTGNPLRRPNSRPTTALLVVEVSDRSLAYDTGDKASLYAAGGIADYWVLDLVHRRLLVFRDPRPDTAARFGHSYHAVTTHVPGDTVAPLAAAGAAVNVADLLS